MDITTKKLRIRGRIKLVTKRPRIAVFKSNKYFYAQVIEYKTGNILASINTRTAKVKDVKELGRLFAEDLKRKKIIEVVFDRSGYAYHGKVKNFADSLRENGIKF